ncbi:zinc finger and BTB domain-containing protein 38 [Heteronotia binoei]|uniref:zinc finger and BTB domain-containing protein 38 n=1 Tax=Heteronotia binoei TaxID=13085 RepID=UPI00292D3174|nr:zinc finger and BTB domain-containing protein 38 [Heteronotia binoei]XP_060098257.1 zinc finger and BTB domain-containing protein 38 [Heteronotia binoei]XP_060098258.1 zinc finger and BTB domain-containing protein 38 [Heteronotia binoei]XP_060098260.1 zinc finger and BTB domain-containing protein 38 [Heteronotia binoei]XP_060098261.1 zinc finger and BTB domain-containing protein 38 [Heteronotia binoei]XP_060098262.1 zinc finger and BTB domain-containing protein 38 [Heteronotia binoei]XP_06
MTIMSHLKDLKDDFHSDTVLSILNEQRIRGVLCDVTIIVEDTKFKAHSNILAASSLYFKNIFWSRTICISGHVLELDDLKAEVFTEILNYIYSSTVVIKRQETVLDLAAAGKKLGISFLEDLTEKTFSNSPKLYSFCNAEKGEVKEEKRQEESAITNGPRITNAYSIFESENSNNLFSPLDLRASFKKIPETTKASQVSPERNGACKDVEPASTLAEHSYAVTASCDAFQRNSFYHPENNPLCKLTENGSEAVQPAPLTESTTQVFNTPKTAFNSQVTDVPSVKVPAHKGTNAESTHKVVSDQTISLPKTHTNTGNVLPSQDNENKSDPVSGSIVTAIPHIYNSNCCTESFNDGAQFSTHLQLHTQPQEPLVCKYCSKQFESTTGLEAHEQVCRGLSNVCVQNENEQHYLDNFAAASSAKTGASYINSEPAMDENNLTDHPVPNCTLPETDHFVNMVDGQILYTCNVCKRTYVTLSSLRRHSNVHSWRRTYPCHYCNKVFALAEYRTRHEIWHTGERRYQCIFCLETFMTYYILKNHQKSFHAIDHRLGVNKKTANGGLKPSVYPYKLYRLLPMKCRRSSYKSYENSSYENIQVDEATSSTSIIQNTINSELPSLNFSNNILSNTSVSLDTAPCNDAAAAVNPSHISSQEASASQSVLKNDITYCTARPLASTELSSGPQDYKSSIITFSSSNASENSASVINYSNSTSSVIMHSSRVSSVIMHSNAINAIGKNNIGSSDTTFSQAASNDHVQGLEDNKRARSNREKKKVPQYDRTETSEEVTYVASAVKSSNTTTDIFEPLNKTETYIAKPALPGTSADSNVAPLCQITVKIGNEAIVKRHILGSKLFYKKGRRSRHESKEEHTVQVAEREKRERSVSRVCRSDYIELNEMCDDLSDHDSNDKPWRPYYNYKPKKKSKQLRKIRKAKWREKCRSKNSYRRSEKAGVINYALRNISGEKNLSQEDDEKMPSLHCELCERQHTSAEEALEHLHRDTVPSESYICDLCQKQYQSPSALRMHMRSHAREKPYPCKTCGKSFSISGNLEKHERTHLGVKDFVCQYCHKAFTLNETLKIHERIHTGEKRYHCQFCSQSFLYLSTKRNHEQRHKREKSGKGYACFQCPKVCKTAAALGMHQKKHLFKNPKQEDKKDDLFHESTKSFLNQRFVDSDGQHTAKPLIAQRFIDPAEPEASSIQNVGL